MNFFTKTKFLIAVIIILSAIILAIFGTLGYHSFSMNKKNNAEARENPQPGRFMAKQLQLTPEQIKEFDSFREKFHAESTTLTRDSRDISKDIMDEIMSENPDIGKLKTLAERFGKLQAQQKQIMINHLLEIRSKCSSSQQGNFKKLVKQMENHDRTRMNREKRRNNERRERD